jgi:hypothetical protein
VTHNPYAPPVETGPERVEPQPSPEEGLFLRPHRGAAVLTLGITALFLMTTCLIGFATGIPAWVMGSKDLSKMHAGVMDPSGHGMTRAGKICGQVATILSLVIVAIYLLVGLTEGFDNL